MHAIQLPKGFPQDAVDHSTARDKQITLVPAVADSLNTSIASHQSPESWSPRLEARYLGTNVTRATGNLSTSITANLANHYSVSLI